jgi:hypothetical protein
MGIDPADPASVQSPISHELDNITVRHDWCSVHLLVVRQQLRPPAFVSERSSP